VSKVLDVKLIKSDFPIFNRRIRDDQKLIYLDSAATSQKPEVVVMPREIFTSTTTLLHIEALIN